MTEGVRPRPDPFVFPPRRLPEAPLGNLTTYRTPHVAGWLHPETNIFRRGLEAPGNPARLPNMLAITSGDLLQHLRAGALPQLRVEDLDLHRAAVARRVHPLAEAAQIDAAVT